MSKIRRVQQTPKVRYPNKVVKTAGSNCIHRGKDTGRKAGCRTCNSTQAVYECGIHGECIAIRPRRATGIKICDGCSDLEEVNNDNDTTTDTIADSNTSSDTPD